MVNNLKKSYNHLALSGENIDDEEFIKDYNENSLTKVSLDPKLAYTRQLMETVIDLGINEDLEKGIIDDKEAKLRRMKHNQRYRELLARNDKM